MGAYLKREGSIAKLDESFLSTMGIKRKTVRTKILQRLAGISSLKYQVNPQTQTHLLDEEYDDDFEVSGSLSVEGAVGLWSS